MSFGQQSGPPASAKQVQYLLDLLEKAGHDGFRDARGPMGFTQRQAGGKFTRDEASAYIEQLLATDDPDDEVAMAAKAERLEAEQLRMVRDIPTDLLSGELQRRGWSPTSP